MLEPQVLYAHLRLCDLIVLQLYSALDCKTESFYRKLHFPSIITMYTLIIYKD